jgi:hypothetical protein
MRRTTQAHPSFASSRCSRTPNRPLAATEILSVDVLHEWGTDPQREYAIGVALIDRFAVLSESVTDSNVRYAKQSFVVRKRLRNLRALLRGSNGDGARTDCAGAQRGRVEGVLVGRVHLEPLGRAAGVADGPARAVHFAQDQSQT